MEVGIWFGVWSLDVYEWMDGGRRLSQFRLQTSVNQLIFLCENGNGEDISGNEDIVST